MDLQLSIFDYKITNVAQANYTEYNTENIPMN